MQARSRASVKGESGSARRAEDWRGMRSSPNASHSDVRSSALWGAGSRKGELRSSALWGKGGRRVAGALLAFGLSFVQAAEAAHLRQFRR